MPKKESLIEMVERLDREYEADEPDTHHVVSGPSSFERSMGEQWPRISKAVRELHEYVRSSGHPAELELVARLDEGGVEG